MIGKDVFFGGFVRIAGFLALAVVANPATTFAQCVTAKVVALDQPFFYNRLGAINPAGMIFALERDVIPINGMSVGPGNAQLRFDKRPRPLVLRVNAGGCLTVNFKNLLAPVPVDDEQPATRSASVRVLGMQLMNGIASDGSNVGRNPSSLVAPGGSASYTFYAQQEGTYLLYSAGATTGGEGDGGSLAAGLFGTVNVEPPGAKWYRSQVTRADLELAKTGTTPGGQPMVNYEAVYPAGHPNVGLPILNMLQGNEIVHSDLTAIITGPNADGQWGASTFSAVRVSPNRQQPFREFTVVFHDEIMAVQAFAEFESASLEHTLHSVRDSFAMNYGTGGIGAEILANRFGVGPMKNCTDCKYEEFFLTAWVVGDPAMVVDVPANASNPTTGKVATKAFYPDDPSNVYHSYINDHVKFRNVHAGPKEHHIFHLHAHQWLHTPGSDNSAYLDSEAIGPGSGFTYEIAYNGSGNRNQVVGDSIFHCHFYPHFAQGMWSLWRSHDVFEWGTKLGADGRPLSSARALPDGEILAGTPIPAVVPLPGLAMAPMPGAQVAIVATDTNGDNVPDSGQVAVTGTGNPGYPFFIPGKAGHRPPKPPLDTVDDGGLPRHVITGGTATLPPLNPLDFSKVLVTANAIELPEDGTPVEKTAMAYHGKRWHSSFTPSGSTASFKLNGNPPKPGAPYSEPCVDDAGNPVGNPRLYKAADIQIDGIFNKSGWHFPQMRLITLWSDVQKTVDGTKPPEPFFFRANSGDCVEYHLTNLVPGVYEQDDFQVRTPTDVLGQHIHLVKFDVTASDGSANGFNYEDGSLSPDEVIERIEALNQAKNAGSGGFLGTGGTYKTLAPRAHPYFGVPGAQTTVQRWFADDVLNWNGKDRTLRTVYTHDHFSPSTHQQAGLYAGLVVEPRGSTWRDPETGATLGGGFDGGPTSWRADILTPNAADSYREFLFEFGDFQLAYDAANNPVNPPGRVEVGLPFLQEPPGVPRPEAVSADDVGTAVVNYRNEPIALRVRNLDNTQAAGDAGDLSQVFRSDVLRADPAFNTQPGFYPPLTGGVQPGDPFTPLLRAYEGDKIQVRVLVGSQEEGHNFSIHGVKWLFEPSDPNSGYRNSQMMGISEHFEFLLPAVAPVKGGQPFADYLYRGGAAVEDLWNGAWGILRAYNGGEGLQPDLLPLPSNPEGKAPTNANPRDFKGVCPTSAPSRNYSIAAVTAKNALPAGTLVYNGRGEQLQDPTAIFYVRSGDLKNGKLKSGVPIEPLILRANAGDCINITLQNLLPAQLADLDGFSTLPMIVDHFNANQVKPSTAVGLHAQLVDYDVSNSDGDNAGFNPIQTVGPGGVAKYKWYAGNITIQPDGTRVATPVEFGAINLMPADPIKHSAKGLVGALIVEPEGSTWVEDASSRASATVTPPGGPSFREFVVVFQNDINLRRGSGDGYPVANLADAEDPEDSGQKAFNYRTEPMWFRMGFEPDTALESTRSMDFTNVLSNSMVGGDPVTPLFTAKAGTPVRFRVLHPGGHQRNDVFVVHGHGWQEEPYLNNSSKMGYNPLSEWTGSQAGHGPTNHLDVLLNKAGGAYQVPGDYLYRTFSSFLFDGGQWGIFRVTK